LTSNVMIVEQTLGVGQRLGTILGDGGFRAQSESEIRSACAVLHKNGMDLVVLGPSTVGPANSLEFAKQIRNICAGTPLLLVTDRSSEELAISALRSGISEYVKAPFEDQYFITTVDNCISSHKKHTQIRVATQSVETRLTMIGSSAVMRELRERLARLGSSDTNVLITG